MAVISLEPTDFGFTGQRNDSYIKLIQMGARWYDPQIGRWLSPDTIIPDPTNPQSLNRYAYVKNNPLKYLDPTGHAECWDAECKHRIHPITKEFFGNKELVKSTCWPLPGSTEFISERPKPPSPDTLALAENWSQASANLDTASLTISGGGFAIELIMGGGTAALAGPEAFPAGYAAGVEFYQPLNALGDILGEVSTAYTMASDFLKGDLYLSYDQDGLGLVVPPSTQVAYAASTAGFFLPEAALDATVDTATLSRHMIGEVGEITIGGVQLDPRTESYFPTRKITIIPNLDPLIRALNSGN